LTASRPAVRSLPVVVRGLATSTGSTGNARASRGHAASARPERLFQKPVALKPSTGNRGAGSARHCPPGRRVRRHVDTRRFAGANTGGSRGSWRVHVRAV